MDDSKIISDAKSWVPASCLSCGRCCYKYRVTLINGDEYDDKVPRKYTYSTKVLGGSEVNMKRRKDGSCYALDRKTKKCKVYENRPYACRVYKKGSIDCKTAILHVSHKHIPYFVKLSME